METVLRKAGKTNRERSIALAERLAKVMGTELVPDRNSNYGVSLRGIPACPLGIGVRGPAGGVGGVRGLLDVGYTWGGRSLGLSLPAGIARDSSDEEVDLVLSAMGF